GVRIELGEIESVLAKHEAIKEAVVMIVSNQTGENYICAYIVPHPERQVYEPGLREYLGRQLTDYMIPSYFVQLEKIPVTAHGKIDRSALPASGVSGGERYTAPGNELERKLVELWAEVLARDPLHASQLQTSIGIYDNFFQWGGHSLKFMVLAAKIHKVFHVKIPLPEIFKMPRLKEMAEYIKGKSKDIHISIEPAEEKEYYPLSSAQKRLYVLQQMGPDSTAYNMPGIIPLPAGSDPVKIKAAFKKLIERHESLRTSFHMIDDTPVQKIHKNIETEVFGSTFFQKGGPPEAILKNFIRPFDLSRAPLLRAGLAPNGDGGYMLLVDMHHIISDAVSHEILALDFTRLYRDQGLPALRLAYKDYSEWQNRLAQTDAIKKQEDYWLAEFRGQATLLDMPLDYERTGEMHFQGSSICFEIDAGLTAKVKKCAARFDVTLMMYLFAVYNILLAACTCREEVIVGTVTAGRRHADLQNIIGFFVNMLAIKTYPAQDKTFSQYLPEVKEKALNAFENQEYPFDELVGKLGIQREPGRHPFVDVVFVFRDENNDGIETGDPAFDESLLNPMKISHFDLMFHAMDRGETISVVIEYSTSLFKAATIEGLARVYREILAQVTANNDIPLAGIEISHHFLVAETDFIRADNGDWEL
ncbi:MAG TPA: condensation domain-containing protein, partial [Candidatus Deferrimicrobium sp.]|nr:condensation domain-containing protein [Candidatus Deferrimicrobium sp.]